MLRSKSCALLFGFLWCFCGGLSAAPVEVDPATPSVKVTKAKNGVPLVNIAKPNKKGLSHNKYIRYNVESKGQILNNSTGPTSTQLSGWVDGNPNLTRSAATILNEVTSTHRSLLHGYIEVAGPKANVIIANPNGISVNGGGFINTSRATLTTGKPQFNTGGALSGFNITSGDILIEDKGFNVNNVDSVSLFAKTVQLNAAVHANDLRITGGSGKIDLNGNLIGTANTGTGISIDASAFGAVYANSITLIGTEKGVGVNLPPEIQAKNSLNVTAGGRISFKRASAKTLRAKSRDADIRLSNRVHADSVSLDAKTTLALEDNNAVLSANDSLILEAANLENKGEILAGFDEEIKNKNSAATAKLSVGVLDNFGNLQSAGTLNITAESINNKNSGDILADKDAVIRADSINNAAGGTISSLADLAMFGNNTAGLLDNSGEIKAKTISAELAKLDNKGVVHGTDGQTLNISERIDNAIGAEITSDGAIEINKAQGAGSTAKIDNKGLISARSLDIGADSISNSGALYSRSSLKVSAKNLDNQKTILGDDEIKLLITNKLSNSVDGVIYSGGNMLLAADENSAKTAHIENRGLVQAEGNITVRVVRLDNLSDAPTKTTETVESKTDTDHNMGGAYDFDVITTTVTTEKINSSPRQARILSGGDIHVTMDELNNINSLVAAAGDITLTGGTVNNDGTFLETTTTKVTKMYRAERYCSKDDSFGNCKRHSYRSAYAGTKTSETVERQAYSNTGIVAGGTLTSDLVTLSNGSATSADDGLYRIGASNLDSAPSADNGSHSGSSLAPTMPTGSYGRFITNQDPGHPYLIESNPLFTDESNFFGSDYLIDEIEEVSYKRFDAADAQWVAGQITVSAYNPYKRLGDAAYETHWVADQVIALSKQRRLPQFGSDTEQFKGLMDNALALQEELNLNLGVSLSKEQIAALDRPIVWMEFKNIDNQSVLTPVVYLASEIDKLNDLPATAAGPQMHGTKGVDIKADNIDNQGDITSGGDMALNAKTIGNLGGRIKSTGAMAHKAQEDVVNTSGEIAAGGDLDIEAKRLVSDRFSQQKTNKYSSGSETFTELGVGGRIRAGKDINIKTTEGVEVTGGTIEAVESVNIDGGEGDIQLGSSERDHRYDFRYDGVESRGNSTEQLGSSIKAGEDATLNTSGKVRLQASSIQTKGATKLNADQGVVLEGAKERKREWFKSTSKSSGFFGSSSVTEARDNDSQNYKGSSVSAGNVEVQSGEEIDVTGSQVVADADVELKAAGDIDIKSGQESQRTKYFLEEKRSGLFSNGGLSITLGKQEQSTDSKGNATSAAASTVGSIDGDVNIETEKSYSQIGSDVVAPSGDINIKAGEVNIAEAREINKQSTDNKFKQSGLTLSLSNPVINTVQTAQRMKNAAKKTDDPRMQALAAAAAGLSAYESYSAVQNGQAVEGGNIADQAGGIKVSISLGTSKSSSSSSSSSNTARGSTVVAGGDINITAQTDNAVDKEQASDDVKGDVTIRGSDLSAGENIKLDAEGDVNLQSAQNIFTTKSDSKSSSASIGVSFGVGGNGAGLSLDIAASKGKGEGEGETVTQENTNVTAENKAIIETGRDANLKGAVVEAEQIQADIGRDLNIKSRQDTSRYRSESSNSGFAVSIPIYGGSFSAGLNHDESNVESDYASVQEQSGFKAGDKGFQIDVKGDTQLAGGVIGSTDSAVDNNRNSLKTGTLSTSDISNRSEVDASSSGYGLDTDMVSQGKYGIAKGIIENTMLDSEKSRSSSGQTRSAISEGAVVITDEAGQLAKTGRTAESTIASLNRDVINSHVAVKEQDVEAVKAAVEAEREIKHAVYRESSKFTDEAYRVSFQEKAKIYEIERDGNGNYIMRELTDKEKNALKPGSDNRVHVFTNGIFNDENAAAGYASQMSKKGVDNVYLVYFPEAKNALSELVVAGYQKYMEGGAFDLTNPAQQVASLMDQYGKNGLDVNGHSRGAMTVGNTMEYLSKQAGSNGMLSDTKVNFYGPAYNAQKAAELLHVLSGGTNSTVQLQNHADDFVGVLIGDNPATFNQRPADSNKLKEWINMFGSSPTVHGCYESVSKACTDAYGVPVTIGVNKN